MDTKVFSGAKPRFHLSYKSIKKPKTQNTSSISFKSQITKSRLSIKNPTGSGRTRPTTRIRALYAPAESKTSTTTETLYELLGIAESVNSLSEIKKAYKQMALKYHPDVSPPDRVDEYTTRFIMVHEAYETLSDPHTRASYDRNLAKGLGFSFSGKRNHHQYNNQSMEETEEMRMRWQSQLDELKKRSVNNDEGNMSWAARMRNQRL